MLFYFTGSSPVNRQSACPAEMDRRRTGAKSYVCGSCYSASTPRSRASAGAVLNRKRRSSRSPNTATTKLQVLRHEPLPQDHQAQHQHALKDIRPCAQGQHRKRLGKGIGNAGNGRDSRSGVQQSTPPGPRRFVENSLRITSRCGRVGSSSRLRTSPPYAMPICYITASPSG